MIDFVLMIGTWVLDGMMYAWMTIGILVLIGIVGRLCGFEPRQC